MRACSQDYDWDVIERVSLERIRNANAIGNLRVFSKFHSSVIVHVISHSGVFAELIRCQSLCNAVRIKERRYSRVTDQLSFYRPSP